jgi:hypothetical protein
VAKPSRSGAEGALYSWIGKSDKCADKTGDAGSESEHYCGWTADKPRDAVDRMVGSISRKARELRNYLVARAGIEPATFRFSGGRSYRLSYLAGRHCVPRRNGDPDGTRTRDLRRDRAAR